MIQKYFIKKIIFLHEKYAEAKYFPLGSISEITKIKNIRAYQKRCHQLLLNLCGKYFLQTLFVRMIFFKYIMFTEKKRNFFPKSKFTEIQTLIVFFHNIRYIYCAKIFSIESFIFSALSSVKTYNIYITKNSQGKYEYLKAW